MTLRFALALTALLLLGAPALGHVFRPSFFGPTGEKKVGQYVWVWHTVKVPAGRVETVEADCPIGDVVLGGGYRESDAYTIAHTTPNGRFDGWIVDAPGGASTGNGNLVTVY